MGILGATVRTRNHLWIVGEEVKALFRMANQLVTRITLSTNQNQLNDKWWIEIDIHENIFDRKNYEMVPWIVLHSTALRQKCHTSTLFQELDDFLPTVWNRIGKQCLLLSILLDKTCRQPSRNSSFPLILPKKLNNNIFPVFWLWRWLYSP